MKKLTAQEIGVFSECIVKEGGKLVEFDQKNRIVRFSFISQEKMLVLISKFKADKRFCANIRINSKIVDGLNILTVDPR